MKKLAVLTLVALLAALPSARAGLFGQSKVDPKDALATLAALGPSALDLADGAVTDPKQKAALAALKVALGGDKPAAAPGYPRAVTNYVERFPDGTRRIITNIVEQVLTFEPVVLPPLYTPPAAPPAVPPAPVPAPAVSDPAAQNSAPGAGGASTHVPPQPAQTAKEETSKPRSDAAAHSGGTTLLDEATK